MSSAIAANAAYVMCLIAAEKAAFALQLLHFLGCAMASSNSHNSRVWTHSQRSLHTKDDDGGLRIETVNDCFCYVVCKCCNEHSSEHKTQFYREYTTCELFSDRIQRHYMYTFRIKYRQHVYIVKGESE